MINDNSYFIFTRQKIYLPKFKNKGPATTAVVIVLGSLMLSLNKYYLNDYLNDWIFDVMLSEAVA